MGARAREGKPVFFESAAKFGAWLEKHHARERELLIGFHKKATGRPSLTWEESVEQALRYGWIDGVRHSLGDESYTIRFTPRRPRSIWSAKNLKTIASLIEQGLVTPAGLAVYEARDAAKTNLYSFESEHAGFDDEQERSFRNNRKAWDFFQSQAPSYRKAATHWVISAKKPETRAKRLAQLIDDSAAGLRIKQMRPAP